MVALSKLPRPMDDVLHPAAFASKLERLLGEYEKQRRELKEVRQELVHYMTMFESFEQYVATCGLLISFGMDRKAFAGKFQEKARHMVNHSKVLLVEIGKLREMGY